MPDALVVVTEEGFWGEELLETLEVLDEASFDIELATPGGRTPFADPRSADPNEVGALMAERVEEMEDEDPRLEDPDPIRQVEATEFDAVIFPGGHGTVWDVNTDVDAHRLVNEALEGRTGKAVVICHAVGLLAFGRDAEGNFLAEDRTVTGFPNAWEDEIVDENECMPDGQKLPYRIEDVVKAAGAEWDAQLSEDTSVQVDGDLITVRGPSTTEAGIETLLEEMGIERPAEQ